MFFKYREDLSIDVIIFVSSDVVSLLCLDTNNDKLHKLTNQIYYFYYLFSADNITIENEGNVFANLDISNLKWND